MRGGRRAPDGASVLTIRVSRDGGRTYAPPGAVAVPHEETPADPLTQLRRALASWPPCQCPTHRTIPNPR